MNTEKIKDAQDGLRRQLRFLTEKEKHLAAFLEMATWHEGSTRPAKLFDSAVSAHCALFWCNTMKDRLHNISASLRVIEDQARKHAAELERRRWQSLEARK